jgi:DMSO/TMAO reductase YedYZ molybdopterin-dependent catalytic subunit
LKSRPKTKTAGQKSRRRFTKTLAAALVAAPAVAASSGASAQTSTPAREPKAPPNPQTTPTPPAATPQQPATPRPSPVAEAYAGVARARFGGQLSDEEFARVRRDLEGNVRASERLGASKLKNSDEPDFIFGA